MYLLVLVASWADCHWLPCTLRPPMLTFLFGAPKIHKNIYSETWVRLSAGFAASKAILRQITGVICTDRSYPASSLPF